MDFEDAVKQCITVNMKEIEFLVDEEVDRRFKDVSCFFFVNDNGEECLQFYSASNSDLEIKAVKLSEIERWEDN